MKKERRLEFTIYALTGLVLWFFMWTCPEPGQEEDEC